MENLLQEINGQLISLEQEEINRNNIILDKVLSPLLNKMKQEDCLFNAMFRRIFYGGSYYDGLKVGAPVEFDLYFLMDIPRYAQPQLTESTFPSFVQPEIRNLSGWMRQPEAMPAYRNFGKLLDNDRNVNTDKVLRWMEGIIQRSLNDLPLAVLRNDGLFSINSIGLSKSGPALTLKIFGDNLKMDVDLVPCFVFQNDQWPTGFRPNPVPSKPEFFVVPKKPKECTSPHHWRLSFQEQERVLINNKAVLKPSLKLLKTLRDQHDYNWLASYYIKTIFLHACEKYDESFWNRNSLSHVFLTMLKECQLSLEQGNIPYYWKNENNMIQNINRKTLKNANQRLKKIIRNIERNQHDPEKIAKLILTPTKYRLHPGGRRGYSHSRDVYLPNYEYIGFPKCPPINWAYVFVLFGTPHISGIILIRCGEPRLGFSIILLFWLCISAEVADEQRLDIFTQLNHTCALLYVISINLNFCYSKLVLCSVPAIIILEFLFKPCIVSVDDALKACYSLALVTFWMFSYTSCDPMYIEVGPVLTLVLSKLKLTLFFGNAFNEFNPLEYFTGKLFLLQPIFDFIFVGNFTFDHYIIVLIASIFYYFRFALNCDSILITGIILISVKCLSFFVKEMLTFENLRVLTLLSAAVFCNNNPNDVKENLLLTGFVGLGLVAAKDVATVLDQIGFSKYMIASMLTSCVVNYSLEVL